MLIETVQRFLEPRQRHFDCHWRHGRKANCICWPLFPLDEAISTGQTQKNAADLYLITLKQRRLLAFTVRSSKPQQPFSTLMEAFTAATKLKHPGHASPAYQKQGGCLPLHFPYWLDFSPLLHTVLPPPTCRNTLLQSARFRSIRISRCLTSDIRCVHRL